MWAGPLRTLPNRRVNRQQFSAEAWHEHLKREYLPEDDDPELDELVKDGYLEMDHHADRERVLTGINNQTGPERGWHATSNRSRRSGRGWACCSGNGRIGNTFAFPVAFQPHGPAQGVFPAAMAARARSGGCRQYSLGQAFAVTTEPPEVHHIPDLRATGTGVGRRAADTETIPLCPEHHRWGPRGWQWDGPEGI